MSGANDIQRTLQLFSVENGLIEIRALDCWKSNPDFQSTQSGYFDKDHLADAEKYVRQLEKFQHASGIYILLNPANPDLLARAANRVKKAGKGGTTKDEEIVCRRSMLVDFDPKRPAGVSSTDEELAGALEQAKECVRWLCDNGWPLPVIAMSGNGWHLLYRVILPSDDKRIEACLKSLALKFPLVDSSTHNAARITKLYGTLARKGDSTTDRPHRRSKLIEVPEHINVVAPDCLDWLAIQSTKPVTALATQSTAGCDSVEIPLYLRNRNVTVLNEDNWDGSRRWFIECPGIASHTTQNAETDCCVWQDSSGKVFAKCLHNSCGIHSWADFRDALGKLTTADFPVSPNDVDLSEIKDRPSTEDAKSITIRSAGSLIKIFPSLRPPIIEGIIRRGETMNIIAAPKTGKSWLSMGLGLAVVSGQKWLGRFWTTRGKVLIIDNELHPETSAHRLPWIAKAMNISDEEYADRLFVTNLRGELLDMKKLASQLAGIPQNEYSLIILDAWYRFQPEGTDENSNSHVSALYNLLDSVASKIGCAFVCIHHTSKGNQSGKGVTDVGSGAGAQSRAPDAHLVMRLHEQDNAVVVDAAVRSFAPIESFCLRWNFPVWEPADDLDPKDIRQERSRKKSDEGSGPSKEETRSQKQQAAKIKVLEVFESKPDGDTESRLSAAAGMNNRSFAPIHNELLRAGHIVDCIVKKTHASYAGFKITDKGMNELRQLRQLRQNTHESELSDTTPTTAPPLGGSVSRSSSTTSRDDERCGLFV